MLKDVLSNQEKEEIMEEKYKKALLNFSLIYKNTKSKNKHPFIRALKQAGFTKKECLSFNFKCGKKLWKSCMKTSDRDLGLDNYFLIFLFKIVITNYHNLGGQPKISKDLAMAVNHHMKNVSQIASNRTVMVIDSNKIKQNIPVRYSNISWIEAYKSFSYRNELSFSTFYKYIDKIYKKPHRKTDLCQYCHEGKGLKREIVRYCSEYHYVLEFEPNNLSLSDNRYFQIDNNDLNCSKLIEYFLNLRNAAHKVLASSNEENVIFDRKNIDIYNEILSKLKDYYEIQIHKCIANGQRETYNSNRTDIDLLQGALVFEIDFKQKIVNFSY